MAAAKGPTALAVSSSAALRQQKQWRGNSGRSSPDSSRNWLNCAPRFHLMQKEGDDKGAQADTARLRARPPFPPFNAKKATRDAPPRRLPLAEHLQLPLAGGPQRERRGARPRGIANRPAI
eukprot:gene15652-biopygen12256